MRTRKVLWLGQVSKSQVITPRPMKVAWNPVFGCWDFVYAKESATLIEEAEAKGFEDVSPDKPGVYRGQFGRTLTCVGTRETVRTWLQQAKQLLANDAWNELKQFKP